MKMLETGLGPYFQWRTENLKKLGIGNFDALLSMSISRFQEISAISSFFRDKMLEKTNFVCFSILSQVTEY